MFHYQSGSMIDEVQILSNDTGGLRAYLHASEGTSVEQLEKIQAGLAKHQWKYVPTTQDDKPVLEVRGFKKPEELIETLRQQGVTGNLDNVEAQAGDTKTTKQKWSNSTLKAAGFSYNVGDAAYLTYTISDAKKDWNKGANPKSSNFFGALGVAGGIGYALGSLALSVYGSRDQSQNTIQAATKKVQTYLHKNGIKAEDDSPVNAITKEPKRSFFGKIDHLFAKYPSEILNTIYLGVGGALTAVALYKGTRPISSTLTGEARINALETRNAERWDVGLGAVTAASALTGILVKEKKIDPQDRREGLGRVLDWVQEKPLRATGVGYGVSTLFHGIGTYKKYKSGDITDKKNLMFRAVFVATNVLSEVLLSVSSKGHGVGVLADKSADKTVLAATAELIFRQPEEKREALVHQLAGYIDSSDILSGNTQELAAELKKQLQAMQHNPWAQKAAPLATPTPETTPTATPETTVEQPKTRITANKELFSVVAPQQKAVLQS